MIWRAVVWTGFIGWVGFSSSCCSAVCMSISIWGGWSAGSCSCGTSCGNGGLGQNISCNAAAIYAKAVW